MHIHARLMISLGAALLFIAAAGCEKNTTGPDEGGGGVVDALAIICNPLSPEPGADAQLTVLATGTSGSAWPAYYWSVEAGTLRADKGISVGWKAPETPGVYHIEVYASLDESADSLEKDVMVRNFEALDWDFSAGGQTREVTSAFMPLPVAGGIAAIAFGRNWYGTHPVWGYHALINSGTTVSCKTDFQDLYGGDHFTINNDVNQILGSMYMTSSGYFRKQRMDVWLFPMLGFGTAINISESDRSDESDDPMLVRNRKNQHVRPYGSAAMDMVVWEQSISGLMPDGTDDEFNIAFSNSARWNTPWSEGQPPTFMTLTRSYYVVIRQYAGSLDTSRVYYKNIKPILTPQEDNVIYFVDSTETFEPCLVPIVGGEPDTTQRRALMVSLDHGIFWAEGIDIGENTIFQWNPVSNMLGFIDTRRFLCLFDYSSESVNRFTVVGKVSEFAWSPDGTQVALVQDEGVSIMNLSGIAHLVFLKERPGDEIYGVSWSHDPADPKLVFRVVRKGAGEGESFSAIVVYSDTDEIWYYASPRVAWSMEPTVQDYTWMRVIFEDDDSGIYAPMPVAGIRRKEVMIYHSYE